MQVEHHPMRPGDHLQLSTGAASRRKLVTVALSKGASLKVPTGAVCIVFVIRGSVAVDASEGHFLLGSRQWLVLEKNSGLVAKASLNASAWLVAFDGDALIEASRELYFRLCPNGGLARRDLWRCARGELKQLLHAAGANEALSDAQFIQMLSRLCEVQLASEDLAFRCPGRTLLRKRQVLSRLRRAKLYIDGNSHQMVRVSDLATLTMFSPWYFSKAFQKVYGTTPQDYASRKRLERARDLVLQRRLAVGEVAAACGFENACSFARAFRLHFGVSASGMRAAAERTSTTAVGIRAVEAWAS